MRTRALAPLLALAAATAASAAPSEARASWFGEAGVEPARHEIAVVTGGARTVVWTRLRFTKASGGFALVVPAPDGSALDVVPAAWLDALDRASAPRIFPPGSVSASCPGDPPPTFEIFGVEPHEPPLSELETLVLDDGPAVGAWAQGFGFTIPAPLATRLAETPGRFWVLRFGAQDGEAVSPTLRVTLPKGASVPVPIGLSRAGDAPLDVTAWLIRPGRGALVGADPASLDAAKLTWRAADERSDYLEQREGVLDDANADGAGPLAALVEAAGHDALVANVPIHDGDAVVDGALGTYFLLSEEAGALQGASAASCIAAASGLLESTSPFAEVCAPGDHGSSGTAEACAEDVGAGQLDPSALRCGYGAASGVADDLALAFAGQVPSGLWLTRFALRVPVQELGASFGAGAGPATELLPSLAATQVSFLGCQTPDGGTSTGSGTGNGSSGSGSGSGTGSGAGTTGDVYIPTDGCDCGDPGASSSSGVTPDPDTGEIPVSDSCDCGDTGAAAGDSCDCGDGAVDVDACDCGSALGALDGCDCSVPNRGKRRRPRVSAVTFLLGCLLVPLRRWAKRRRPAPTKPRATGRPRRATIRRAKRRRPSSEK